MMTLETGDKKGITLIEILVVIIIISLIASFSVFFPHKAIRQKNLDLAIQTICEMLHTGRSYAIANHKVVSVVFENNSCGVYLDDGKLLGKVYKFPQSIVIKEKTDGFSPVEFLPEGAAKQAGHLIIEDTSTKKTRKIILYNLTGLCTVEKTSVEK